MTAAALLGTPHRGVVAGPATGAVRQIRCYPADPPAACACRRARACAGCHPGCKTADLNGLCRLQHGKADAADAPADPPPRPDTGDTPQLATVHAARHQDPRAGSAVRTLVAASPHWPGLPAAHAGLYRCPVTAVADYVTVGADRDRTSRAADTARLLPVGMVTAARAAPGPAVWIPPGDPARTPAGTARLDVSAAPAADADPSLRPESAQAPGLPATRAPCVRQPGARFDEIPDQVLDSGRSSAGVGQHATLAQPRDDRPALGTRGTRRHDAPGGVQAGASAGYGSHDDSRVLLISAYATLTDRRCPRASRGWNPGAPGSKRQLIRRPLAQGSRSGRPYIHAR